MQNLRFLRLQQVQDSYDFRKWLATTGQNCNYDWSNNTLPYLDIPNDSPFEPIDMFSDKSRLRPKSSTITKNPNVVNCDIGWVEMLYYWDVH